MGLRVLEGGGGVSGHVITAQASGAPCSLSLPSAALRLTGAPSRSHIPTSLSVVFLSHLQLEIILRPCLFTYFFFVCLFTYHPFLPLEVGRPQ